MTRRYDDLSQEYWDSACDNMPQDYLDDVMAQIDAVQPSARKFIHDPKNIWERYHIWTTAREYGKFHPREGQPDIWSYTNAHEWYLEGLKRWREYPHFPYIIATT